MLEIDKEGNRFWFNENNKFHRANGPAIEYRNGSKAWWFNGKLHRVDGPAVELSDGGKSWYLDWEVYTEEEYREKVGGIC